ncbi:hypothetical protein EON63_13435 [archaeon]|nr:MAG: hypothetical protein EON63_13435 [archaeon]
MCPMSSTCMYILLLCILHTMHVFFIVPRSCLYTLFVVFCCIIHIVMYIHTHTLHTHTDSQAHTHINIHTYTYINDNVHI